MDQRNLILAIVLSLGILITYEIWIGGPQRQQLIEQSQVAESGKPAQLPDQEIPTPPSGETTPGTAAGAPGEAAAALSRTDALARAPRVAIDSATLSGSIALEGGLFDDLVLKRYRETIEPDSPQIKLLHPVGVAQPYYVNFGWAAGPGGPPVPGRDSLWQADRQTLAPGSPVTLSWDNGQGLHFEQRLALDDKYMFTVIQSVVNSGQADVQLSSYGLVSRSGTPTVLGFYILHEGLLGVFNNTLEEIDYSDLVDDGPRQFTTTSGWLGITDKYWLVALVPDQEREVQARFLHTLSDDQDKYQSDYLYQTMTVPAGGTVAVTSRLFAGAKEAKLLDAYRDNLGIPRFDRAVDFGWFYFLTKPFFYALHYFAGVLGNFGLSILLLTVLVKLAFFPLANKSYKAMAKMRKVQPEMLELRERYGDDKQKLNQEMMALYKREGANPVSGCLPVVIQIPVFFALYKVLFVTIEMRHAPFYGWIQDLSARDPTTILNGFGLIPWDVPDLGVLNLLNLGVWPLLMGVSMVLQQRLNPQPADPVQAKIFLFMPIIFTFLLAQFPAGLVIYWTWNNLLSMLQQAVIMKRAGVPIGRQPKKS
ncbi:MAG TPA: membrane protein insertase YidC [Kiloniellales bacterium]